MRRNQHSLPHEEGFTLIEMLIALAIFASLITVLLSGYAQGLSLWQRSEKISSEWKQYESRSAWMRRLSEQLVAADYRSTKGGYVSFFLGDMNGFKALSSAPIMSPPGRTIPVEFRLINDAGSGMGKLLYREGRQGEDPDRGVFGGNPEWIELFDSLKSAQFSYFTGAVKTIGVSESAGWKNSVSKIPQQIAFTFEDKNGHSHQWRFRSQSNSDAMALVGVYEGG